MIAILRRETKLRISKFYFFLALYGFALTVSTIFSTSPQQSFYKLLGEFYLILLGVLTFNLVCDLTDLRRLFWAWTIGTILTIAASFFGFALFYAGYKNQTDNFALFQYGTLPSGNFPRLQALFSNANMMCNYLNVSLVLVFIAVKAQWLKRLPSLALQTAIWFAALFTFSPGIGGMFLAQGLWNWAKHRKTSGKFALGSLFVGISLALAFFVAAVAHPDTANTNRDFPLPLVNYTIEPAARPLIWQQAVQTIAQYPIFGKGLGTDAAFLSYTTLSNELHVLGDAHNTFLSVAAQTGFFGFAVFAILLIFLLKTFLPVRFENNPQIFVKTGLEFAFVSAFLYQGLAGSFEDARHLWILIGLIASFAEQNAGQTEKKGNFAK